MTRASWFLLAALLVSACTTTAVREDAPRCSRPLCGDAWSVMRPSISFDLTVPWAVRTYVVGPCSETDVDFSASQRTAP